MEKNRVPLTVDRFKVGDQVRVPLSGWTGVVVEKSKNKHNGYKVRWDSKPYKFSPDESWVRPLNLEKV